MPPTSPGTQRLAGPNDASPQPAGPCCRLRFHLLGSSNARHKPSPPLSSLGMRLGRASKERESRRANHLGCSAAKPWGKTCPRLRQGGNPRETHGGSFPGRCRASLAPKRVPTQPFYSWGRVGVTHSLNLKSTRGLVVPVLHCPCSRSRLTPGSPSLCRAEMPLGTAVLRILPRLTEERECGGDTLVPVRCRTCWIRVPQRSGCPPPR